MSRISLQALVGQGYRPCPTCAVLLHPDNTRCSLCGTHASTGQRQTRTRRARRERFNPHAKRGHLGTLAERGEVTIVVHHTPVAEGSVSAPAAGVIRREHGSELEAFRQAITREAARVCGGTGWVAANAAVQLDVAVTVPAPVALPNRPVLCDSFRDVDKLLRSVCDALCPHDAPALPAGDAARFRLLASDMRIYGFGLGPVKTYPRPRHTHFLALDQPGILIRVRPAVATLTEPDEVDSRCDSAPWR